MGLLVEGVGQWGRSGCGLGSGGLQLHLASSGMLLSTHVSGYVRLQSYFREGVSGTQNLRKPPPLPELFRHVDLVSVFSPYI